MLMLKKLMQRRAALQKELDAILDKEDRSAEDKDKAKNLLADIREADDEIAVYRESQERQDISNRAAAEHGEVGEKTEERATGGAKVTREERTYSAQKNSRAGTEGGASFFVDAFNFDRGSYQARERLERHAREVVAEGEISERATTTSSFAGLVVPQYLVDQAALLVRAGRPFANTVQHAQLPDQGMSFYVPRGTTGASAAVQASENTSVSSTDEVWANLQVNVATVAGQQDVSRQSLERGTPGIDQLIYNDLAGAYGVAVDQQCLSGSGSAGQVLGVFNTAGVNQATAFAAAATAATFYSKTAGQISAVETSRYIAPDTILMHPRRWNWLLSQVDSAGRPLAVPNMNGPYNAMGLLDQHTPPPSSSPTGAFLGLPVVTDASVPTAAGSGPEDQELVYRSSDLILWEDGDGMPKQLRFEQTLGNQLTIKVVIYNYIAFTAGRYPQAVGIVGGNSAAGNGLVAPTF